MTKSTNRQGPATGALRRLGAGMALAAAVFLTVPAASQGALKFGAKLGGDPDPVAEAEHCPDALGYCTRAPLFYSDPTFVGPGPYAPEDGTIDKIKLVADDYGQFTPVVVKIKGNIAGNTKMKVKAEAPYIVHEGTGEIETFDVDLPVKQGERIAMRVQYASALHCDAGVDNEAIAAPFLTADDPFTDADYYTGCTQLVQAVMED